MVDTGKPYVVASIVTDIVFRKNVGVIIKFEVDPDRGTAGAAC
jgi:hypothetical protein